MNSENIYAIDELYGAKLGVGVLSILGSFLASHIAHKKLEKQLESTPKVSGGLLGVKKILESQGLPKNFVVGRAPGLRNAIFSGASSPSVIEAVSRYSPDLSGKLTSEDTSSASRNGMILFDPDYARAGVIAHEGGHAKIHAGGGLSRVNQKYLRPTGQIVSAFSPLLGSAAGYASASPVIGGLVGGLSGVLGSVPTIVNEAQATQHAKEYLDKSNHRMNTKENSHKALSHAYFSYLTPAIISALGGAASGAIAGQIGKMEKGAKYSNKDDDRGDKPIVPKPVVPGLGLAGAGLGVAGLGGLMLAPSAIDSVNRFSDIGPNGDPIKSLDTYTIDGGNLLRSKFYGGFSGLDVVREGRKHLLPDGNWHLPMGDKIPFVNKINGAIDAAAQWARFGPHEHEHYGQFQAGPISAESQLIKELTHPNAENNWTPDIAKKDSFIDRKILTPLRGSFISHEIASKVKDLTGKEVSQLSPEEQIKVLPQVRESLNSIPVVGKIYNKLEQDLGRNVQGGPGYTGKGQTYNTLVVNPLNTLRKGLLYTGAGLAVGGGAYALYKYMQYRKQKAEQEKQQAAVTNGIIPKTASVFASDVKLKNLSADTKKDIKRFVPHATDNHVVPQYGVVLSELLPKCDKANLNNARAVMREECPKKMEKDFYDKLKGGKYILIMNDRVVDGHHMIAKGELCGCTCSLNVLDLTPLRFQKSAEKPGLWANIRAKRKRGGKPAKPGQEGYPDKKNWNKLTHESKTAGIESFLRTMAEYDANTGHIRQQLDLLRSGAQALQKRTHFLVPHKVETAAHGLPSSQQHLSDLKNYIAGRIGELAQNPYVKGLGEELHGIANHFGIK